MENLSDDLLVEIFCRLPCKFAVRCKAISKHFLALISQQSFIEQYIHHHHTLLQHMNEDELEKQWQFHPLSKRKILMLFQPNNNNNNNINIHHLHDEQESRSHLKSSFTVGCSNGLLLCRRNNYIDRTYFVCNPVTKQYLQLPPPPPPPSRRDRAFGNWFEGFVCDPCHHKKGNRVSILRHHRYWHNLIYPRFRVVLFPLYYGRGYELGKYGGITRSEFEMVVFCSETGQWNTKVVSCTKGSSFEQEASCAPAAAHGGKLYFSGKGSVLVYDPFDKDAECDVIEFPSGSYPFVASTGLVGVSCGNIRLCVVSPLHVTLQSVSVWELEPGSRCWCLVHSSVVVPDKELEIFVRCELLDGMPVIRVVACKVRVRAIHPHHGDVVLLQCAHRLFFWNLKTNQFHTAGVGYLGQGDLQVISLDLPWLPTPIPSIVGP